MEKMTIALPVYDNEGIQVDTTSVELTREQIEDIINTAANVVYSDWAQDDSVPESTTNLRLALAELDEALISYSVIEDPEDEIPE